MMRILQSSVEKALYMVLFLVFLSVVLIGFNLYQQGRRNHEVLVNNCRLGNEFRTDNQSLWEYILTIPPSRPLSAEQKEQRANFETFLNKTFEKRDCERL
jgi:hypothetical protein